jgi:hypothetical protein
MPLSRAPKEGSIVSCRYGDDQRRSFIPHKLRPVLIVGVELDPILLIPVLSVAPITTSPRMGLHRTPLQHLDFAEPWRVSPKKTSFLEWGVGFALPLDKLFFPDMDANGHLPITGQLDDTRLHAIQADRARHEVEPDQILLNDYRDNPESIRLAIPAAFRHAASEGTRLSRGKTGPSVPLKKQKKLTTPKP